MKAIILSEKKADLTLCEMEILPLNAGEVRVKIQAAAFNRRDYYIQQGQYPNIKYPLILGSDGAGIVSEIGENVPSHWQNKAVIINPSHNWGNNPKVQAQDFQILGLPEHGTFAEYVKVPCQYLAEKPDFLSFEEAAALPLAGLTAYRALFSRAQLQAGENVLITGIGGGAAVFALQFALAKGANVYVTSSSPEKIAKAVALGAKGGVNYKEADWHKQLQKMTGGFDVIIDSAGGEGFALLADVANPGGRIAIFGGTRGAITNLSPQKIFWKQLSILGTTMGNEADFAEMGAFVTKHQIRPVIDSVFPVEMAQKAIEKMGDSRQMGKIVLGFVHADLRR